MRILKYLLVIAVIFYCIGLQSSYAQRQGGQALADSLINELPKAKSDTDRVKLLRKLAAIYTPVDQQQGLDYARKAMELAKKANWKKGIGLVYMTNARIYRASSEYAAGLENAGKAYETLKALDLKPLMGDALIDLANNYEGLGYYSKSIENNFKALSIYEATENDAGKGLAYNNLGNNYYRLNDYPKAIENYNKALELHKRKGNKFGIASALDNIASVYMDSGELTKANDYNLQAIKLFEEINDEPGMARIYFNRGNLMQNQKDFNAAYEFYNRAMAIDKKLGIKSGLAFNNGGIGELYLSLAKNEAVKSIPAAFKVSNAILINKAHFHFAEALKYSKDMDALSLIVRYSENLSETEALRGNYKAALAFYKQAAGYNDSIFNDENRKKVAALENQRIAEIKDKEIQLLNKDKALQASEIKRQTLIKNIIIAAVAVAAVFAFFLVRSFNKRQKVIFDKQVLQTEMKALRAQMNPHFIFNSLHSINKYVMENDKDKASEYLSKFAKLMRLILENSRESEVPLESDLAALELYMQLESLRFQNRFKYKIEIGPGIDKENTLIPPLMLQPFAENAIVHGIKDKDDGLIKINIRSEKDNMILCVVEDNGTGRQAPPVTEQTVEKKRKSLGLKIMQERLNVINQLKKAKAAVHVFDLKDAENKPRGLRIELLLPLQLAF